MGYTNLCTVTGEKNLHLSSMERTWERGKEETIIQSSFGLTFVHPCLTCPGQQLLPPGQRDENKQLQEGRNICNNNKKNSIYNSKNVRNNHALSFVTSTFMLLCPLAEQELKIGISKLPSRLLFKVPEILSDHVNKLCCKGTSPGRGTAIPVGTNLPTQGLHTTPHETGLVKNRNIT